jgi:diguanylate cyclase (GGDEF)-like protein
VIGETPGLWKSGRTPQATYEQMWSTILAGEQWRGELLNRKRNGELFWEEASISPIKDDQGTITHFVALKEDITERKRSEQVIWHQAHHDHLTGLANRQLFRQRLETGIAQSDEGGHTLALLFVDLDKFKPINDRLGHDAGDTLLQEVARRLESCLRDTDTAARLGGDEFAILLPTLNGRDGAEVVADKVLSRLAEPYRLAGEAVGISASVGIALYPDGAHNAETLLQFADTAMYTAKAAGRNTYRFHQGE